MTEAGIPVVALLDNPTPTTASVYECVACHEKDLPRCAFDRSAGISISAVIGNVLVYRQGSHITRTFADSAESRLSAELFGASGGRFGRKSG